MTTTTAPLTDVVERPVVSPRRIFADSLRFEWTKMRTVRSTVWTLLAAIIAMLGIAILVSEITVHEWATTTPADRLLFDRSRPA